MNTGSYIDGKWFHPKSERLVRNINPADLDDVIAELAKRGVELRTMPSLWPLRDAVVASTLAYSIIRMRNAQPRLDAIPKPN